MRSRHLSTLSLILLFFAISCDMLVFKPSGENFVDISPEPVPFNVNWNTMNDTLGVWGTMNISYSVNASAGWNALVGLVIGNHIISEAAVGEPLVFDTRTIDDGIYPIQLIAYGSSNTGSLLDKLGGEFQLVSSSIKYFYIDNAPLGTVSITQFTQNEDGTLTIDWEKYKRPRIESYYVKDVTNCYHQVIYCRGSLALHPGLTSWTDTAYDGTPRTYAVLIEDPAGSHYVSEGERLSFDSAKPITKITSSEYSGEKIRLQWEPSAYPSSFDRYLISYKGILGGDEELSYISNIDQTEAEIPLPLGTYGYLVISVNSKQINPNHYTAIDSVFVLNGNLFFEGGGLVRDVRYNSTLDQYLVVADGKILLFDGNFGHKKAEVATFSGTHMSYGFSNDMDLVVIMQNNLVEIYNTADLSVAHKINLRDFYPQYFNYSTFQPMIDSQKRFWFRLNSATLVINLNTMTTMNYGVPSNSLIQYINPTEFRALGRISTVSGSGDYNQYSFFLNFPWALSQRYDPYRYLGYSKDGSLVFTTNDEVVAAFGVFDHQLKKQFLLPSSFDYFSFDLHSSKFYYYDFTIMGLVVRSVDSGNTLHQISLPRPTYTGDYFYEHEIIWTQNGIFEFIHNLEAL